MRDARCIFLPVAYLGIVGSSRIFSDANPIYTVSEVEYQIKNTGTSCILAHPDHVETAVEAARRAGLDKSKIFQFSDMPCPTKMGIADWRDALAGSQQEADAWDWDPIRRLRRLISPRSTTPQGRQGCLKGYVCLITISSQTLSRLFSSETLTNLTTRAISRRSGGLAFSR